MWIRSPVSFNFASFVGGLASSSITPCRWLSACVSLSSCSPVAVCRHRLSQTFERPVCPPPDPFMIGLQLPSLGDYPLPVSRSNLRLFTVFSRRRLAVCQPSLLSVGVRCFLRHCRSASMLDLRLVLPCVRSPVRQSPTYVLSNYNLLPLLRVPLIVYPVAIALHTSARSWISTARLRHNTHAVVVVDLLSTWHLLSTCHVLFWRAVCNVGVSQRLTKRIAFGHPTIYVGRWYCFRNFTELMAGLVLAWIVMDKYHVKNWSNKLYD